MPRPIRAINYFETFAKRNLADPHMVHAMLPLPNKTLAIASGCGFCVYSYESGECIGVVHDAHRDAVLALCPSHEGFPPDQQ